MNSPVTIPSNRTPMASKIRFLGDGAGDVYMNCYLSQLGSPLPALFGPLKPNVGQQMTHFDPNLINLGRTIIWPQAQFRSL
jgi:hypothetical protein